mmetsp:Transcript_2226/g.5697  ORF Transcript_2226/g.5697 Transcript_2226/m.5697 type:complete len:592 (+) Transcript_2226:140-1915(+)
MLGGPGPPGPLPRADRALSRRRLAAGAATAGAFSVAAGVYHHRQASRKNKELSGGYVLAPTPRILLPPALVEAIAGAVGEVVQVAILYPLDTIKVRCQAGGMMSSEVIKDLVAQSASRPASLVSSLYAGVWGATLCSILIGAVHFSSYETSKRFLFQRLEDFSHIATPMVSKSQPPTSQPLPPPLTPWPPAASQSPGGEVGSSRSSIFNESSSINGDAQVGSSSSRGRSGSGPPDSSCQDGQAASEASRWGLSPNAASSGSSNSDSSNSSSSSSSHSSSGRRRARSRQGDATSSSQDAPQNSQQQHPAQDAAHSQTASGSHGQQQQQQQPTQPASMQQSNQQQQQQPHDPHSSAYQEELDMYHHHHQHHHLLDDAPSIKSGDKLGVNVLASIFTAIATALVESPVELFRHNQQAGTVQGNFMREMLLTVRQKGPSGLYWGFLPHCFEALPHDISEMLVMGCMKDFHLDAISPRSQPHHQWLQKVPVEAWDLTAGAASGVAAVLVSMPFDCIKTYMQTHGMSLSGQGLVGSMNLFYQTGKDMVARKGLGCMYYGVVPRLLQQVPSSMMGWWAVHAVVRALQPWTIKESKEAR